MRLLKRRMLKLRTAVISVAVLALIATTAVVAVAQGETSDWQAVRGEAITRIGSEYMGAERDQVADSIANDVTSRGTVWRFMLGSDSGVLYGVGPSAVQPEIQVQTKTRDRIVETIVNVPSQSGPVFGDRTISNITLVKGVDIEIADLEAFPRPGHIAGVVYMLSTPPAGLTPNNAEGSITGTPTALGSTPMTWTATVTDGDETFTDSLSFMITVVADTFPKLQPIGDKSFMRGSAFTFDLPKAAGGNEPYTYVVGIEPAAQGLTFSPVTHSISGTANPGIERFVVTYTVTDMGEDMDTEVFVIVVEEAPTP